MKTLLLPLLLAALALPAGAQTRPAAPPHQNYRIDKVQRAQRTQLSEKKSFRLSYTPVPDPIPLNQHFRLRLQLQDAQNRILNGATLKVDANMPEHNHGMNVKPTVKSLGKGLYEVRGLLFHMPGYWEIVATVSHKGKTEKVIFGVTVVNKATQPADHSGHAGH
ncbi:MAG: FixH family protein [Candidatus Sericytochromatia bacterium]